MIPETGGIWLREETQYISASDYTTSVQLTPENGKYVSGTVTNHGDSPLLLQLGRKFTLGSDMLSTHIPSGGTVTRTFSIGESDVPLSPEFAIRVSYYGVQSQTMNITISARQFN